MSMPSSGCGDDVVRLTIDGRQVETGLGATVLQAALENRIYIPHLCDHPDLPPAGVCRLCVVEVAGMEGVVLSCLTPATEGLVVRTASEEISQARRLAMELILAAHPPECGSCEKYLNCELQSLKQYLGVEELRVKRRAKLLPVADRHPMFVHDPNKCVLCGRCVRACWDLRGVRVLGYAKEMSGASCEVRISPVVRDDAVQSLAEAGCRFCGACVEVCPTGAIQDKFGVLAGAERKAALVPCRSSCPAEIDVPRYVRLVARGDLSSALAVIREKVPFPLTLGHVCDRPCEGSCRRSEVNSPIAIRELKRLAAEKASSDPWVQGLAPRPASGRRVAVVGAGPAGLTAAYYLRLQGHEVTVFEELPEAGGMLRYGIPPYRLPREVLARELVEVLQSGVTLLTGTRVESLEVLFAQGFEGAVVAVGAHQGQRPRLAGATAAGVLTGVDFLRQVNTGAELRVADAVVVIGGGNVALDCARMARRLGAGQVVVACLERRDDMPAAPEEIEEGQAEGLLIRPSLAPVRLEVEGGRVAGVVFREVATFFFDGDGIAQVEMVEGSGWVVPAGMVIFATGQRPLWPEGFDLELTDQGLLAVNPRDLATSREGVFAAGDAVLGTTSVIKAIASGKKAAAALDRYLGGSGRLDYRLAPPADADPCFGPGVGFADLRRLEGHLDELTGVYEASRCLGCDSRLAIRSVEFWGEY